MAGQNKKKSYISWLRFSPHHHSGKLRPHEHTSYFPLALLLIFVGISLGASTAFADNTWVRPEPASGSVSLTGIVPGKPPQTGATIIKPTSGQHFGTSPITVSGSCLKNTLVEIFKNDIFAGSTACSDKGTFTIDADLLYGKNDLVAKVYDALNQAGPDSNIVTVFYDGIPAQASPIHSLDFGGTQMILNTDAAIRGIFPDKDMVMPLDIIGGTAPYAVNIQWGDLKNNVVSRPDNQSFNTSHTYKKPGTYQIGVQASDSVGRVAFITVAAIVNGQPDPEAVATTAPPVNQLLLLWPLYTAAVAVLISFWLGERREKAVLAHKGLLVQIQQAAKPKAIRPSA